MKASLEEELLEQVARSGPIPFAAFMSLALYHPRFGYYTAGPERVGWRGHYLTSPELDPTFGGLWRRAFEDIWESCGRPETFEVVEIGPGDGAFAEGVLRAADEISDPFSAAMSYRMIERSPSAERRQRARLDGHPITWTRDVSELPHIGDGCVFANEILDNLPVHVVQMTEGELMELCVGADGGTLVDMLRQPSNPELVTFVESLGVSLAEGHRMEVPLAATALIRRLASALAVGALVFVDYGADSHALAERPAGTILCYSDTGVDDRYLERPGHKDITSHANWTVVSDACRRSGLSVAPLRKQRDALASLGMHEIHADLRKEHDSALAAGRGADAVRALSRRQALGALSDPGGLGGLDVLVATKNAPLPRFIA